MSTPVSRSAVVAAIEQDAADAGARILRQGGNVVDGAIAAAFAQGVVNPLRCGIGGGGSLLYYDADQQQTHVLSFIGCAPEGASPTMFTPRGNWGTLFRVDGAQNQFGYLASVVPGLVSGLAMAHRRYGNAAVAWSDLLQPAIELAEEGFWVYPHLEESWREESRRDSRDESGRDFLSVGQDTIRFSETSRVALTRPDGDFYRIGDRLVQPDYAKTLRRIAQHGPEEFYCGETAQRIVRDYRDHGGLLTARDLAEYQPADGTAAAGDYRGLELITEGPPSVGPTFLQILKILEGWDLAALGWHSPAYLDRMARACTAAFTDRQRYMGDPNSVDVPLDFLLSGQHAIDLRRAIESEISREPAASHGAGPGHRRSETTHVSVMDNRGNAIGITHSIGSGNGVITAGLGFMHNNHMIQFDPRPGFPNSIEPGKRPNVGGAPVVGRYNHESALTMGSPAGGRKATAMAQVLVNMIDFGMNLPAAFNTPRIHSEDVPLLISAESHVNPRALVMLGSAGYRVLIDNYGARIAGISRDPATGKLVGASDIRGDLGICRVP
jgi:gamma-glutamyltranspeptidase / glutathione hydrolase